MRDRLTYVKARLQTSQAVRGGVVVAVGTVVFSAAAYLYNVACIRYLGPPGYGDVATMLALGTIVALPLGSVQTVLAREVAQLDSPSAVARILRRSVLVASLVASAVLVVGLLFLPQIRESLNIGTQATVAAGLSGIVFLVLSAVLYGFLQGAHRFHALGIAFGLSGLARVGLVIPALLLGLGAAGALAVNTVAALLATAMAAYALTAIWRAARDREPMPPIDRLGVGSMFFGSLAFAFLTNADVVMASYFLDNDASGIYAAAALVGKAVLFLPGAVVTVLLPKAATRAASGRGSESILLASAGVTLLLTLPLVVGLAVMPEGLLTWAFGPAFREATPLLGLFGLAMTAAALVNVYLSVYFAERDLRFPALVGVAAIAQVVAVSAWHPSPRSIVFVTLVCCGSVLLVHELAFRHSVLRIWRSSGARGVQLGAEPD
jgi:O-antigen/teichoic acid export membrane protein